MNKRPAPKPAVTCPECRKKFSAGRLEFHLATKHGIMNRSPLEMN